MNQTRINSEIARATGGFAILILITCVFTFIVGCGGGGATSSGQATHLVPSPDVIPNQPTIADVAFVDTSYAWATDRIGKELYRIDNGAAVQKRTPAFGGKTYLSFVNSSTGFAFAYSGGEARLWRTTDGGVSWQKVNDSGQTLSNYEFTAVKRLQFVDERQGWLSDVFTVWRTDDGGAHWEKVFSTTDHEELNELRQVSFSGSEGAMIATKNGVYVTSDGGKVWKQTNRTKEFAVIYSLDERTSWAWGDWLERTDDGGKTWRRLYELNDRVEIISAHFINKDEGWAAGREVPESIASRVRNPDAPKSNGILLHTKDGGKSWDRAATPTDLYFQRVSFSDSKHGWLLGRTRLYRTTDGVTWTTVLEVPGDQ